MENSKEKQIEEMANAVNERIHETVSMTKVYEALYDADYRKQREGEWIENKKVCSSPYCSMCGAIADKSPYCPHCGAHMRKEDEGK